VGSTVKGGERRGGGPTSGNERRWGGFGVSLQVRDRAGVLERVSMGRTQGLWVVGE